MTVDDYNARCDAKNNNIAHRGANFLKKVRILFGVRFASWHRHAIVPFYNLTVDMIITRYSRLRTYKLYISTRG